MAKEHEKLPGKIEYKYLCYHALMVNPLLFREFFLSKLFGIPFKENFTDYPKILEDKPDPKDTLEFLVFFFKIKDLPKEKRIKFFFEKWDRDLWDEKNPGLLARLFKNVDYIDRFLIRLYREGKSQAKCNKENLQTEMLGKEQFAMEVLDIIFNRLICYSRKKYLNIIPYNRYKFFEPLKEVAEDAYLKALERGECWEKAGRLYKYKTTAKQYTMNAVRTEIRRKLKKLIQESQKKSKNIPLREGQVVSHKQSCNQFPCSIEDLIKHNKTRNCSESVRNTISLFLEGRKLEEIAQLQRIRSNTAAQRISRFNKEVKALHINGYS